ncbi:glycosyltransferase family 2 protein, partial [Candidatus Woesearchaeota archaeon]
MKKPTLSVVLLNYNMKGLIKGALDSLERQDYPKDDFEVIVVDNCSSD